MVNQAVGGSEIIAFPIATTHCAAMRGYFGIGVEGLSKPMNAGTLFRSAHAFGASFVFTVGGVWHEREANLSDTSDSAGQVPHYHFNGLGDLRLPDRCALVGIELLDEAVELPSFRHPRCAAYVLGPERGSLSPALTARCEHIIRIPTSFCVNLAIAGSIVMYDRLISMQRFAARPLTAGGAVQALPIHVHGAPTFRHLSAADDAVSPASVSPKGVPKKSTPQPSNSAAAVGKRPSRR
jgi:tRNA(Leu) C34 or U34 (ribose-2'-O)-methylase TrmL